MGDGGCRERKTHRLHDAFGGATNCLLRFGTLISEGGDRYGRNECLADYIRSSKQGSRGRARKTATHVRGLHLSRESQVDPRVNISSDLTFPK